MSDTCGDRHYLDDLDLNNPMIAWSLTDGFIEWTMTVGELLEGCQQECYFRSGFLSDEEYNRKENE